MEVKFANYRFLPEQQLLYKHDQLIALKSNQARLLDFFLSDPLSIHSKDAIMDTVWQGKVVSEQVVFQTISQLRAILGDKAILTFSKKGYQWQLPILDDSIEEDVAEVEDTGLKDRGKGHKLALFSLAISLCLLAVLFFMNPRQSTENIEVSFHVLYSEDNTQASRAQFYDIASNALEQNGGFLSEQSALNTSVRQAFSAPKLILQQANLAADSWLIWGDTYASEKGIFVHFGLARDNTRWQGYLFASDPRELTEKLALRLEQLQAMGLFSQADNKLDITSLMSMQQIAPDDPDLLLLLARHYIGVQHLDVALTYLQRLTALDSSYAFSPYRANAQWLTGKIYKIRSQHLQAANSLDTMSAILAETPLWPLNFHNIQTKAWLAYEQTDYDAMFNILEQGIALGRKQADPLTLFELHIMYSILAKKSGDDHKKYLHLNEAQALLLKHKLDDSNLAVVYYHFALFTEDNTKAIPYLERILTLPRSAQNYWVQDHAFEMLVNHHIEQQDFAAAHSLFTDHGERPKTLVLKAKVFHAQKKPGEAKPILEKAFELARLAYDIGTGIEAALMLYQASSDQPKRRAEYLAYLESNAKADWLKQHNAILASE
ncbi:winged helix-turn-helix domain-containing protein [Thalassomonas actiniarum]|uniref:Winged helix-turn-helix domain-containing protein n=1 Tax=Thalassomonas actiniarum TaxID=485447 RepID=A0AAE9YTJ0_9GAMM|nr:winged helix-turn-helix domain-containing protein [Thalassomonas actiniarum]WDE00831.1 winged helix-turn-helix domain-containing protein [Thalassomonas actiniarum]